MSDRDERHARLDDLAARIKDSERSYENAYHAWVMAGNHLRRLEREHRKIWLALFEHPLNGERP